MIQHFGNTLFVESARAIAFPDYDARCWPELMNPASRDRCVSGFPVSRLASLAQRSSLARLAEVSAALQRQAVLVRHPLNPRLFMESALATYLDAFSTRRPTPRRANPR